MITREQVFKIASLARLHLKDEEADVLAKDLECILEYIDQLKALDVTDVKPTSHALSLENVYRADVARPSLPQAEALQFAVEQAKGCYKVPKVIE